MYIKTRLQAITSQTNYQDKMEWKITCTYINNTMGRSLDKEKVKRAM